MSDSGNGRAGARPVKRQFVKYSFLSVDHAWLGLPAETRSAHKAALVATVNSFTDRMLIRSYSTVGTRAEVDLLLWQVADRLELVQQLETAIFSSPMAPYLRTPHSFLAMTRQSQYTTESNEPTLLTVKPGEARYFFVYPFVKSHEWYQLPFERRNELMQSHIATGRKYPNVRINTTYSFGLDDQDFMVGFETDDPSSFLDLVMELREDAGRPFTVRDTPIFSCIRMDFPEVLDTLGGVPGEVSVAAPAERVEPAQEFVRVADLPALPRGRSKLVYIEGEAIALFHTDEGQIYALENRCSHARGNLCEGTMHNGAVICPLHDARFDLETGEALSLPARRPVAAYQVKIEGEQILVSREPVEHAAAAVVQSASKPHRRKDEDDIDIDKELPDLDALDRALLNELQWNFPLSETPWAALGDTLGTSEQDVMARVERLRREGIIRQVSAIFDTRKLGYKSSLVAVRVPEERVGEAAAIINSHPGVSHNYRRTHHFNIWFTLAVPPDDDLDEHLARLAEAAQVEKIRKLPTLKLYKIGVKLDMNKDETALHKERGKDEKVISGEHGVPATQRRPLTERDRALIRELQEDLPTIKRPFAPMAARLGVSPADIFAWLNEMTELGYMRRFAAILRHQRAGFTANGMSVFKVPEPRIDEVGPIAASFPQVSHCYRRPVYEDWPYNLFAMIHARSVENCEQIAADIAREIGIDDYMILYSTEEFKKTRVRYFVDWDLPVAVRAAIPNA